MRREGDGGQRRSGGAPVGEEAGGEAADRGVAVTTASEVLPGNGSEDQSQYFLFPLPNIVVRAITTSNSRSDKRNNTLLDSAGGEGA